MILEEIWQNLCIVHIITHCTWLRKKFQPSCERYFEVLVNQSTQSYLEVELFFQFATVSMVKFRFKVS